MSENNVLPKLKEHMAQKERESFLIVKAKIISENNKKIEIKIDNDPETASNIAERRIISDPKIGNSSYIRLSAGGLGIVIKASGKNYLMTTLRISKSSFNDHLTSFTGLGCISEIINPQRTAIRKGFEDLIILVNRKIIIPTFKKDTFKEVDLEHIVKEGASLYKYTNNFPLIKIKAGILNSKNEKKIIINWKKEKYEYKGIIVRDKGTRGLDFIKLISIDVDEYIDKVDFLDGRIIGGKNLLKRDIYALELDEKLHFTGKISYAWYWDEDMKKYKKEIINRDNGFPMTPVLKTIIEELKNIE